MRGGGLILARRLQSQLNVSADPPSLGADGSVAVLTESAIRGREKRWTQYFSLDTSGPCGACGNGAGAARGCSGEAQRQAHPSIPTLPPRSIEAPSSSPAPGTRLASTRTTRLALLQSAPLMIICSRSALCLRLRRAYRRIHSPDAATPTAHPCPRLKQRSTCPSGRACHLPPTGPTPQRHCISAGCVRKARRRPLPSESTVQMMR